MVQLGKRCQVMGHFLFAKKSSEKKNQCFNLQRTFLFLFLLCENMRAKSSQTYCRATVECCNNAFSPHFLSPRAPIKLPIQSAVFSSPVCRISQVPFFAFVIRRPRRNRNPSVLVIGSSGASSSFLFRTLGGKETLTLPVLPH